MRWASIGAVLGMAALGAGACGGSAATDSNAAETPAPSPTPKPTTTPPPPRDYGQPSDTYPAFKPDVGQLVHNGGKVLTAPVVVTVTWPGDDAVAKFEDFGDKLGASAYWKAVTSEYGVGPATSGPENHVRIETDAPATLSDSDIDSLVAQSASAPATSKWPAPTDQTIYILYLHPSTKLMLQGSDACAQGIGGYHMSTDVKGQQIAYAVVPRCTAGQKSADTSTSSASHELAEAATDPHPQVAPAWVGFDPKHLAYDLFQQFASENADACEFFRDSYYREGEELPFSVARSWSNKAAAAGHNPCVPAANAPYFSVTPLELEDIVVDMSQFRGRAQSATRGVHVAKGETRTIPLGFYSDAPQDRWTIEAIEGSGMQSSPTTRLDLSLDKTSGKNGERAYLTVKVNDVGRIKGELVTIVSRWNGTSHYTPILIGSM